MRPDNFLVEDEPDDVFGLPRRRLNDSLVRDLRGSPAPGISDAEAGVALARLAHDELETYGTSGGAVLDDQEMRELLLALRAIVGRLGIDGFDPPFRDFSSFRTYWIRNSAAGSWQARRDILDGIFDALHDGLADQETREMASSLADAISPRGRTGWSTVDAEIAELRRHFQSAHSAQDYRNVGNDCVIVTEALSRVTYDPRRHLRQDETEPAVDRTKQRLERYIEDELPGPENVELRRLVRATIEMAQAVKHQPTTSRRDAGIAADAVILLANLLRRIADDS